MIKVKASVEMLGIRPELGLALSIVDSVLENCGVYETVITSLKDGTHTPGSWHYSGWAADLRSKHIGSAPQKTLVLDAMKSALGAQWTVLLENLGKPNEHYHIEPSSLMKATK
jgi:hypothetical protein